MMESIEDIADRLRPFKKIAGVEGVGRLLESNNIEWLNNKERDPDKDAKLAAAYLKEEAMLLFKIGDDLDVEFADLTDVTETRQFTLFLDLLAANHAE